MNNNELLVYTLLLVITLLIIGMPKDKLVLTQNTSNLVLGFVCVTLFMLLDKRIAIIFLILLVVTYYENMKTELDNKVINIQLENIKEKFNDEEELSPTTTPPTTTPPTTTPPTPTLTPTTPTEDNTQTLARTTQIKIDNTSDIQNNVSNFINGIDSLKAGFVSFNTNSSDNGDDLCGNIKIYNNKINKYKEETFSNTSKEGFLKDYIPQPVPRAKNFKNSNLVKNISNLESQNVVGQFDIQGCRMLEAKSSAIDYNTNFGPPLAKNETYQTNETIGTPFYPLNA